MRDNELKSARRAAFRVVRVLASPLRRCQLRVQIRVLRLQGAFPWEAQRDWPLDRLNVLGDVKICPVGEQLFGSLRDGQHKVYFIRYDGKAIKAGNSVLLLIHSSVFGDVIYPNGYKTVSILNDLIVL